MCVCVCLCEREREGGGDMQINFSVSLFSSSVSSFSLLWCIHFVCILTDFVHTDSFGLGLLDCQAAQGCVTNPML